MHEFQERRPRLFLTIREYNDIDHGGPMRRRNDRRSFLKQVAGLPMLAPFVSRMPQPSATARKFDPNFAPAYEAVRALREGVISSRELTGLVYQRIKKHNPRINAFV